MATGETTAISGKEERIGERVGGLEEDAAKPSEKFGDAYHKIDGPVANFDVENGIHEDNASPDETHDQLTQMVIELRLQNEYLKAQFGDIKSELFRSNDACTQNVENGEDKEVSEQVNHLHEQIKCLNKEIQEHKETQKAADNALEHLRMSYSEADGKVQELTAKLVEAQQKMEQEIKERDDKYVELDSKFGRLHKRAKQRIQELQKEKDDLEARFNDVNMKAEQASSQQALAQQELERTRQQANEALRSMDAERQQLRTANNKLRDNIEEMRLTLEAKENALEGLKQSLLEKEQMLEQIRGSLQAAEDKRQASIAELSTKHQKQLESLETQLADALSERNKAAETISSLQMLLAEKDSKIAEMDAASTGEAVRLGAALEEVRGELNHLKDQHEKERQKWEVSCQALRTKLEASESACLRSEIESAKMRSQLELELSMQNQLLNTRDAELMAAKDEIGRLESEFSAYKVRAHALLQKKDAELSAAKNSEFIKAQEEAVREAERVVVMALAERDKAIHDLQDALVNHDKEISARDAALGDAEGRIRNITVKLDAATSQYLSEKETWQKNLESIEEHWKLKYHILEAQNVNRIGDDAQKELEDLKLQYEKLKEEHYTFRDIADRAIEEKEKEITRLIEDNKNLHHSLELRPSVDHNDEQNSAASKQDAQILNIAAAEQQILLLARQQAQREEELAQSQRHILALQEEIEELERENRLHNQQEAMLKAELRNMERSQKREGIDMTYLKNVILKLLETGEVEALLPVVATLLQFSPEEIKKCQQVYRSSNDASSSPVASFSDTASTPRSLFSRFSFS
ncbi:protein GRIP [Elaeis guineensis]|uniref:Protein GRIP n=1 Tax=Elaeis guineensis var. tenera TaxID=51953 RepID=A0A6I9R5U5_ELAGV|nr:protein GRIP [Elaeis guineensis]